MPLSRWTALLSVALLSTAACAPQAGSDAAAEYPQRPIELVVPFDAGGSTDIAARVLAETVSNDFGTPVNVVNKPGADQMTGVDYVRSGAPNGYTLLADGAGSSSLQSLVSNLPYEWDDRTFVSRVLVGPHAYAAGKQSQAADLQDVMDQVKQNPSQFSIAWLGGASTSDYAMLQLLVEAGVNPAHVKRVPFQSSGEAMTAAASGDVDLAAGGASSTFSLAQSGDLKVLAVTSEKPVEQLPDVPTTAELDMPQLDILYWVGISGPPELPDAVQQTLIDAIQSATKDEQFQQKAEGIAMTPEVISGKEFENFVHEEASTFQELSDKIGDRG